MQWTDDAILLSLRRHGETSAVASLLTAAHGRHAGLARGGLAKTARGALQPGNRLLVRWQARLAENLGALSWELEEATGTRWLDDPLRLAGLAAACAMADAVLPEREPHPGAFARLAALLQALAGGSWPGYFVQWELGLLAELGYGLDLSACAVTGGVDDLAFVSPKSGRAVSAAAAEPYRARLLPLPAFLLAGTAATPAEVMEGLALTGYFLERHVLGPQSRRLPAARSRLVDRLRP
jgi:DNA repair protein RecO (recombination protein O)